ncbi:unnamed protein product [Caenorhabditis brenneri]
MLDWKHRNWDTFDEGCKEFILSFWDVFFGTIAVIGVVLNYLLFIHFKQRMKGSVFLTLLAVCDFTACVFYLWLYSIPVVIQLLQSDFLANIHSYTAYPLVFIRDFFDLILPFLIFFIVLERLFWTFESSTRHSLRAITEASNKFVIIFVLMGTAAVMSVIRNYSLYWFFGSDNFCDSFLYLTNAYHKQSYAFIQIMARTVINATTFILVLITIFRIKKVEGGQMPVHQEEINLGAEEGNTGEADSTRKNATRIQRSILCMLIISSLSVLHLPLWKYVFNAIDIWIEKKRLVDFFSREEVWELEADKIQSSLKAQWIFDCMGMICSTMRMALYYIICRNDIVVEFSSNGRLQ